MSEPKTHINVRLSPDERKALRIYCAKQGVTAQQLLKDYVTKLIAKELEEVN